MDAHETALSHDNARLREELAVALHNATYMTAKVAEIDTERLAAEHWAQNWKYAAKHWRMIGKGSERGLRNEIRNNRVLMDAINELQDQRPIADAALQDYVQDLRDRLQVEQMYSIDLQHQHAALLAELAAARKALEEIRGRPKAPYGRLMEQIFAEYDAARKEHDNAI